MTLASKFTTAAPRFATKAAFAFPDTCAVQRNGSTRDTDGGTRTGWANVSGHTAIPCLYQPMNGYEIVKAGKVASYVNYEIIMPASLGVSTVNAVAEADRIVVAARGNEPAHTFEIAAVNRVSGVYVKAQAALVS